MGGSNRHENSAAKSFREMYQDPTEVPQRRVALRRSCGRVARLGVPDLLGPTPAISFERRDSFASSGLLLGYQGVIEVGGDDAACVWMTGTNNIPKNRNRSPPSSAVYNFTSICSSSNHAGDGGPVRCLGAP